jgi:hypothetical protein
MSLDRDELAARNMAALLGRDGHVGDAEAQRLAADVAVGCADALIARLRPATVAPVADAAPRPEWVPKVGERVEINTGLGSGAIFGTLKRVNGCVAVVDVNGTEYARFNRRKADAQEGGDYVEPCAAPAPSAATSAAPSPAASPAAYVPKVGDRVMHAGPDDGRRFVVTAVDAFAVIRVDSKRSAFCVSGPWIDNAAPVYDGPATAAERAAAGLPPITPDHPQGGQGAEGDQRVAAGLDAPAKPAFDETSERETAVDIAKDRGLDVAEEVGFVAGWLARARIAAKGGAS